MISQDEIIALTSAAGWPVFPRVLDLAFDPVLPEHVASAWGKWVFALPKELKMLITIGGGLVVSQPKYIAGVANCNKMSRWFATFIEMEAASAMVDSGILMNPPALGPMSYLRGGQQGQGHDIDWYIDTSNVIHYFEKQIGEELTLTPDEIASIFFAEIA